MMRKLVWILSFFQIYAASAQTADRTRVTREDELARIVSALENFSQRQISEKEKNIYLSTLNLLPDQTLHAAKWSPNVVAIFCASTEINIGIGASISACVDRHFHKYVIQTTSIGISIGISLSAYSLIYYSPVYNDVIGRYYGFHAGASLGRYGGTIGYLARQSLPDRPESQKIYPPPLDDLFWIGYATGASLDIAGLVMNIERTTHFVSPKSVSF